MAKKMLQEKYPDTKVFHFFNANPKNRITCDCWLRAICVGLNEEYNKVLMELVQIHLKTGYELSSGKAVEKYLASNGWVKMRQPRKADNTKYTGAEFCKKLAKPNTRYIANIGGHHMVAIVDRKVWDIWDSTSKCIGNYWVKG